MNQISNYVFEVATWLVPLAIAIVFHEVAHGRAAKYFGDMTASEQGRLSLNPIRHIDPIGTVILPLILAVTGAPIFGWAKPVPVNPNRMRKPRTHMAIVAAAGPASNIILALLAGAILAISSRAIGSSEPNVATALFVGNVGNFIAINLFLAVFNMIPIPPFDGSKVLAGLLPEPLASKFQKLDRFSFTFMIILLVVIPQFFPSANIISHVVVPPVEWLFRTIMGLFG